MVLNVVVTETQLTRTHQAANVDTNDGGGGQQQQLDWSELPLISVDCRIASLPIGVAAGNVVFVVIIIVCCRF